VSKSIDSRHCAAPDAGPLPAPQFSPRHAPVSRARSPRAMLVRRLRSRIMAACLSAGNSGCRGICCALALDRSDLHVGMVKPLACGAAMAASASATSRRPCTPVEMPGTILCGASCRWWQADLEEPAMSSLWRPASRTCSDGAEVRLVVRVRGQRLPMLSILRW